MTKITCDRELLLRMLPFPLQIVSIRSPRPELHFLHLRGEKDHLRIEATDLEVAISVRIPAKGQDEEVDMLLPGDVLMAAVREQSADRLAIDIGKSTCKVGGKRTTFEIPWQSGGGYPALPNPADGVKIEVAPGVLAAGLARASHAAARERTRYALNGVRWVVGKKETQLVGTDGRRMAVADLPTLSRSGEGAWTVPNRFVQLLQRVAEGTEEERMTVGFEETTVSVVSGPIACVSRLVEGVYPDYRVAIPKGKGGSAIETGRDDLVEAIRSVEVVAGENARSILVRGEGKEMTISASSPERGHAETRLAVSYDGAPYEIRFNPTLLLDGLRVAAQETVMMRIPDEPGPVRMDLGEGYLYVVQPIRLQEATA